MTPTPRSRLARDIGRTEGARDAGGAEVGAEREVPLAHLVAGEVEAGCAHLGKGAPVGEALLGRVLDGLGRPLDGKGALSGASWVPVAVPPPHPLARQHIEEPLGTGIRAIDALLTVGRGQRMGIFSGPGVGVPALPAPGTSRLTTAWRDDYSGPGRAGGPGGEQGRESGKQRRGRNSSHGVGYSNLLKSGREQRFSGGST